MMRTTEGQGQQVSGVRVGFPEENCPAFNCRERNVCCLAEGGGVPNIKLNYYSTTDGLNPVVIGPEFVCCDFKLAGMERVTASDPVAPGVSLNIEAVKLPDGVILLNRQWYRVTIPTTAAEMENAPSTSEAALDAHFHDLAEDRLREAIGDGLEFKDVDGGRVMDAEGDRYEFDFEVKVPAEVEAAIAPGVTVTEE